jgi:neutral/alkaline ceramidase-like enzyme
MRRYYMAAMVVLLGLISGRLGLAAEPTWKVATARIKITPEEPLWMAGFAFRDHAAEGKLHDLWIKILVLEAADGNRGVIITSDVCGISKVTYETVCRKLEKRCGLARSQVKFTYSHTHSGPATRECLQDYYSWDDDARDRVTRYTVEFEKAVVDRVCEALGNMQPATLWATEGTADFGVNRRNNNESRINELLAAGVSLKGPVDHRVPMLVVRGLDGQLKAIVFGYACHTSMLAGYQLSGDYAGFAQLALEEKHPGVGAMFYQACGGDQGAMPRRTVELTRNNGLKLAAAVEQALAKPMRLTTAKLKTAFEFVDLPFEKTITAEELEDFPNKGPHYQRWAKRMLKRLEAGETFPKSYPYAVQVWRLGEDQLWISMGGEPVVDYSLKFIKLFGPTTWTNGFTHDLTSYIPSRRVWEEGGYEGGFLGEYGLPAMRWAPDVEDRITAGVQRLVRRVR